MFLGDNMKIFSNLSKEKKKYYQYVFLSTFIIGLLIHFYKMSNTLLNHDSIYNYYSDQNVIASGRWFLSVACSFSTWYDLPWVTGLFTIFFIALANVVVVDALKIKKFKIACLSGAILVSFPAITETLMFGFTADGFALAMLLSAVSVWFALRNNGNKILNCVVSVICLTLSIGIYQAYLSFALVLIICYAIKNINVNSEEYINSKMRFVIKQVVLIAISMALYYTTWKVLMLIQNVTPTEYQGIDQVGFSLGVIVSAPLKIAKSMVMFVLGGNILKNGISIYAILNILFILLFLILLVIYVIKNKVYKQIGDLAFLILCVICLPIAVYCWSFTSQTLAYANRMVESISLIFVLFIVLTDELKLQAYIKTFISVFILAMVINNSLIANTCYFYMQQENDATLSMATEMVSNIHKLGKDNDSKIFVVGSRLKDVVIDDRYDTTQIKCLSPMIETDLLFDEIHTVEYLNNSLNCNFDTVSKEEKDKIFASSEYKNMKLYPSKGSIKIIDDVVVIKYAEPDVN